MSYTLKIFRSNKHIYGQFIKDTIINWTLADIKFKGSKIERARNLGGEIAEKLKSDSIYKIRFDRGKYKYHGRVKALAEEIKNKGIKI